MKATYGQRVKQRSRVLLRKFLDRHLADKSSARVLCLPGHEAREIVEVYDKLGIPRRNVTCLERNPSVVAALHHMALGVEIIEADFNEFAGSVDSAFDVISLDFMGHAGTFDLAITELLSRNANEGQVFLHTNFLGGREGKRTRELYSFFASPIECDKCSLPDTGVGIDRRGEDPDFEPIFCECEDWIKYRSMGIHNIARSAANAANHAVTKFESYRYVGDKGANMFGDIFMLSLSPIEECLIVDPVPRRYLGDERSDNFPANEATTNEPGSKSTAVAILKATPGLSADELAALSRVSVGTARAVKAHFTMGRYT